MIILKGFYWTKKKIKNFIIAIMTFFAWFHWFFTSTLIISILYYFLLYLYYRKKNLHYFEFQNWLDYTHKKLTKAKSQNWQKQKKFKINTISLLNYNFYYLNFNFLLHKVCFLFSRCLVLNINVVRMTWESIRRNHFFS